MNDLRLKITRFCDLIGDPLSIDDFSSIPSCHTAVLEAANGFVTRDNFFRFFGTQTLNMLPSHVTWNQSSWRQGYGEIFKNVQIFAEDIFGDQYCIDLKASNRLCKVYCEGARREWLQYADVIDFLNQSVLMELPTAFDFPFAKDALNCGKRANLQEHLAFQLPLILGGDYSLENLGVESIQLHLGLLAQITSKNASIKDGTLISRFID